MAGSMFDAVELLNLLYDAFGVAFDGAGPADVCFGIKVNTMSL